MYLPFYYYILILEEVPKQYRFRGFFFDHVYIRKRFQ